MSKEMIVIKDLKKSFGDLHVLKGVNLTIAEKRLLLLSAPAAAVRVLCCAASTFWRSLPAAALLSTVFL